MNIGDVRLVRFERGCWSAEVVGKGTGVWNYRTPFGALWALRRWRRALATLARMQEEHP